MISLYMTAFSCSDSAAMRCKKSLTFTVCLHLL